MESAPRQLGIHCAADDETTAVAGVSAQRQAANFMLGKVRDPYMTRYINAMAKSTNRTCAKFAVIPDIHAINYPQGMHRANDSGATMNAKAVFEVKIYSASMTN